MNGFPGNIERMLVFPPWFPEGYHRYKLTVIINKQSLKWLTMNYIDHWRKFDWEIWENEGFVSCCSNVLGPITFWGRERCHCVSCITIVTAQATVNHMRQMLKSVWFSLLLILPSHSSLTGIPPFWAFYDQMSVTVSVSSRERTLISTS